jgi:L-rhamnose mutarotase
MNRYCFRLRVDPARIDEYTRRHASVWPEMLHALTASGWHNYSLFLAPDGLLIGYFESEGTLEQAQAAMARTAVNARWQSEMSPFFLDLDGSPDTGFLALAEVFHLEDQLAAVSAASIDPRQESNES